MSSFAPLNAALTGLQAHKRAIEVAGHNIQNMNTDGYTKQRLALRAEGLTTNPTIHGGVGRTAGGVTVDALERLGDAFLDIRLRQESGSAGYATELKKAYQTIEANVNELDQSGISETLRTFYTSWSDVANRTNSNAARATVIENGKAVAAAIGGAYTKVDNLWSNGRNQAEALVVEVNTAAEQVAGLNTRIQSTLVAGGSANELMDQRALLVNKISGLTGATARELPDGSMDVLLGGNQLVHSKFASKLELQGAKSMNLLDAAPSTTSGPLQVVWADTKSDASISSGQLGGILQTLRPATTAAGAPLGSVGSGGAFAEMGRSLDNLAMAIATEVNAIHTSGRSLVPDTANPGQMKQGGDFFSLTGPLSAAQNMRVAITDTNELAIAKPGAGVYDGSKADEMSKLISADTGATNLWGKSVVDFGVKTASAKQRADVADISLNTAKRQHMAGTGVELNEEVVALMAGQHAFSGAARVMTTVDEMLDVLINRTGVVGR